ncbi:MAG: hypothetical protein ABR886_02550 [Dehalococcoidales bacterium]|jgi:hypothetical protein
MKNNDCTQNCTETDNNTSRGEIDNGYRILARMIARRIISADPVDRNGKDKMGELKNNKERKVF